MRFRNNGLYFFLEGDQERLGCFQARSNLATISPDVWHKRLGHLSGKKMCSLHVINEYITKCKKIIYQICPLVNPKNIFPTMKENNQTI